MGKKKGKRKDTLKQNFILLVDNYLMVRNFLPEPGKAVYPLEKNIKRSDRVFLPPGSPSF